MPRTKAGKCNAMNSAAQPAYAPCCLNEGYEIGYNCCSPSLHLGWPVKQQATSDIAVEHARELLWSWQDHRRRRRRRTCCKEACDALHEYCEQAHLRRCMPSPMQPAWCIARTESQVGWVTRPRKSSGVGHGLIAGVCHPGMRSTFRK